MALKEESKTGGDAGVDKHPEKRAKAAYLKFEEERIPEMRKEYPTLKLSQLKEKLWKEVLNFSIITYSGKNIQIIL